MQEHERRDIERLIEALHRETERLRQQVDATRRAHERSRRLVAEHAALRYNGGDRRAADSEPPAE